MNDPNRNEKLLRSEIYRLVTSSLLSQEIPADMQSLEELLGENPLARHIYYECLTDTIILRDISGRYAEQASSDFAEMGAGVFPEVSSDVVGLESKKITENHIDRLPVGETDDSIGSCKLPATAARPKIMWTGRGHKTRSNFNRGVALALGGAIAALIVVGFSVFPGGPIEPEDDWLAEPSFDQNMPAGISNRPSVETGEAAATESEQFVARVLNVSSDVSWSDGGAPRDFLFRLRPNEHVAIASGFVEIEFHSSARMVLHGPARLVPLGSQSARLEQGKLTGQAENGGFQLETGAAEVIDIGTAFGVAVDDFSGTDVYVFDGEVKVTPMLAGGQPPKSHLLTEGIGVRVGMNGGVDYEASIDVDGFIHSVPHSNSTDRQLGKLSLIDIVSGGDGLGNRLAGAIDPLTGDWDHRDQLYDGGEYKGLQSGDGVYRKCSCNDLVDGVLVPEASPGEVQVDSAQHRFALGATEGCTYGPLWVRRKMPSDDSLLASDGFSANFWGTGTLAPILVRLADARTGLMGIHPNVGVTFDLTKIRSNQKQVLSRFQATLVNLDNAEEWIRHQAELVRRDNVEEWVRTELAKYPERTADVCILVDGKVRYTRINFSRQDGDSFIDVEITEQDRFLTILSTDAGNATSFDHLVLVDPEFVLTEVQR